MQWIPDASQMALVSIFLELGGRTACIWAHSEYLRSETAGSRTGLGLRNVSASLQTLEPRNPYELYSEVLIGDYTRDY